MTRLLLDTHAALFWWAGSAKLGERAREAMSAANAVVLLSAASPWEIATKFRLGKLPFRGDPAAEIPRLMATDDFVEWPIRIEHSVLAGLLPGKHRDPFDRIIAAQALKDDLTVVTRDPEIAGFGCKVLW